MRADRVVAHRSRNGTMVWVMAGAACLALPAVLNGLAFTYYDTAAYVDRPDGPLRMLQRLAGAEPPPRVPLPEELLVTRPEDMPLVHRGRSMFYRLFGWATLATGGLWPAVALQALAVSAMLMVLWRRAMGLVPGPRFVAVTVGLTVLTPLGYFTGLVMPDALAGLLVAAIVALLLLWRRMSAGERAFCGGIAFWAMLTHSTHVLIAGGLLALAALAWGVLRRRRVAASGSGAAVVAVALVAAVLLEFLYVELYDRRAVAPLVTYPHLTSGLVDAGPGTAWLHAHCPTEAFVLCDYRDRLPMHWIDFLFEDSSPQSGVYSTVPPARAREIAAEQLRFALAVLRDDPGGMALYALAETGRQLIRFGMDDAMIPPGAAFERTGATFPDGLASRIEATVLHRNPALLDVLGWLTYATVLAAVVAMGAALLRAGRSPVPDAGRAGLAVAAGLLAGVVLNAIVCGVIAAPYDRFQARIIWLVPMAALLMIIATHPRRNRAGAPG